MDPVSFVKHIRSIGVKAAVLLAVACALAVKGMDGDSVMWAPLLVSAVFIAGLWIYARSKQVLCDACRGEMKISAGYPRIVFTCTKCGNVVDTQIHSDY